MHTLSYCQRRGELRTYFDKTASATWEKLTSDAPVSRIRATVRAGRDQMRSTMLDWLPADLSGRRILDAGCGTGSFSIELAKRGADVVAIDIAESLVGFADQRSQALLEDYARSGGQHGKIEFRVGDMLDPVLGHFDHVVAMDSLIHYQSPDMVAMIGKLAASTRSSIVFTFAPRTPALTVMHTVGLLFPRRDRAPAIEPVDAGLLRRHLTAESALSEWREGRALRINTAFYKSYALELTHT